jgi:F1F0 ATPase subunit 2
MIPVLIAAGALLAVAHLGSLWLLVRRMPDRPRPARWLAAGMVARLALLLTLLWLLTAGRTPAVIAVVAGFLATRTLVARAVLVWARAATA